MTIETLAWAVFLLFVINLWALAAMVRGMTKSILERIAEVEDKMLEKWGDI